MVYGQGLVNFDDVLCYFILFFSESDFMKVISANSCPWWVQDTGDSKCKCPPGFKGDGIKTCAGKVVS